MDLGVLSPVEEELRLRRRQTINFCAVTGLPLALSRSIVQIGDELWADAAA